MQIQFSAGPGGGFRTLRTVTLAQSSGYFDTSVSFPGAGTVRLAFLNSMATSLVPPPPEAWQEA